MRRLEAYLMPIFKALSDFQLNLGKKAKLSR